MEEQSLSSCEDIQSSTPERNRTMDVNNRGRIVEELPGFVTLYEDGSVVRHESNDNSLTSPVASRPERSAATGDTGGDVASTDITIDQTTGLWARIFLPEVETATKIPVVLYFHGGGFCLGSPAWKMFDSLCSRMATATGSLWVSVAYRLAPEHPLPAGYEDCVAALAWLGTVARGAPEPTGPSWLSTYGDFGQCFLAGDSVGGNVAHTVAVSAARSENRAVRILGLILMHPGFVKEGEIMPERPPDRALVTAEAVRAGAVLALPAGCNLDYFVMNPDVPNREEIRLPPAVVIVGKMDIFYEREVEYRRAMEAAGQEVEVVEYPEMGHCFMVYPQFENSAEAADELRRIREFMAKCRRGVSVAEGLQGA